MTPNPSTSGAPAARYPFFTPALGDAAQQLAATIETPLRLEHRGRWDPDEEHWGEPGEPLDTAFERIIAAGAREAWELEQVVPGRDWETDYDPILESVELAGRAERERARLLLESLLATDPRCLDAHAHLGLIAYDYSASLAQPHFEAGVAAGERSLPAGFNGVLPWGWIDNRPFLRCLHGYGLCLWRLGRFAEASRVLDALLWLNPSDNQGARFLIEDVRAGVRWPPASRDEASDPFGGAGRRNLLDRAAPVVDAPPRTPSPDAIEAAFTPLLWLLERGWEDGLPLTQAGALGQRIVREAAVRLPDWWNSKLFGPPHREADLPFLEELHALLRRSRLLRKHKRRLLLTNRARSARDDPDSLLEALAPYLIDGDPFKREVSELACAALLVERELDRDALVEAVHGAVAGAWRKGDGGPVTQPHVDGTMRPFLYGLVGLGPLSDGRPRRLALSDIGAELLARSLRHRATAAG
jgi:tetratricopeptide (TPR) repeat protein